MSRYIDADKLMLDIRLDKRPTFRGAKIPPSVKETMFAYLDSAPHIDIVRCKECKSWKWIEWAKEYRCTLRNTAFNARADDFCSYGERSRR